MNNATRTTLIALLIPTAYALVLRFFFGIDDWNKMFSVMTFNFYAGWWGKWIMKDILNNILRVEKRRSEGV